MATCQIGQECVTSIMSMIEVDPQPFILEPEITVCDSKLCEAITEEFQGPPIPPLEYLIGREELLAFMFNNDFPPVTQAAVVPLPAGIFLLMSALALLVWKGRTRVTA